MKIIVPEPCDLFRPQRNNFLNENFTPNVNIIYQSIYDTSVYIWVVDSGKVFIYIDSDLELFDDSSDACSWVYRNDLEDIFTDLEETNLTATLTIS